MRNYVRSAVLLMLITASFVLIGCQAGSEEPDRTTMWYSHPAEEWMEALPIGNGRLGAMVYGGITNDRMALNESTMWSGKENPQQDKPFGRDRLLALRRQFLEGDFAGGQAIALDHLNGNQTTYGTHLPIGDLKMSFNLDSCNVENYRRQLSLDEAVCTVTFASGGINYKREYFSSNPDKVMIVRFTADKQKSISFSMGYDLLRQADITASDSCLSFSGTVDFPLHGPGGVSFEGCARVVADGGTVTPCDSVIIVNDADAVTLIVDVRTNYRLPEYKQVLSAEMDNASAKPYEALRNTHVADYQNLFNRVSVELGGGEYDVLPTDERWKRVSSGAVDTGLDAMFFQYGRYLTIASSREDSPLPIALQGFFNDNKACNMGWTNDYHLDINTQQNYWAANICNLAECNAPLFSYIADLAHYGATTARTVYGAEGWTAHTTANVWGYTAPSSAIYWGLFPTAGSWIATHLWTEFEYTKDIDFLRNTAYPLLKGNAEFLLSMMTEDPNTGYLVTGPSISPENGFRYKDGKEYCASIMPTVDRVLAYEIFNACARSAELLDIDADFRLALLDAIDKLPPLRIGRSGGIMEWYEDYEEAHPNHRHTSHLLALYPYSQITLDRTPELADAARKTIEDRLSSEGWEDTEWSRANMICYYARLKDAEEAYRSVKMLLGKLSRHNLLTVSPGGIAGAEGDIYAVDGNTAGTAGMAEMLVQTQEGYVELLPCLPKEWSKGSFSGLCIRGGGVVSAQWADKILETMSVRATVKHTFHIKKPMGRDYKIFINDKPIVPEMDARGVFSVDLESGDVLRME